MSHVTSHPSARRWRMMRITSCVAAMAVAAALFFPDLCLPPFAAWLDIGRPPTNADYVVILPGGEETRPFVAAALVKQGYAPVALIPETAASPETQDGLALSTGAVIRRVLVHRGVSESQIQTLPSTSTSTWEDAEALAAFLQPRSQARVLVVTHHHHTRRARWVFRRVLGDDAARITFVAAPTDEFEAGSWWRTKRGLLAVLGEYAKFAFYLVRCGDWRVWSILVTAGALLAWKTARQISQRCTQGRTGKPETTHQVTSMPAASP